MSAEQRLLDLMPLDLGFVITAEGVIDAYLFGELQIRRRNDMSLAAWGTFMGDSVRMSLTAATGRLFGEGAGDAFDEAVPAHLHEALLIGLSRMGVLHNLARLNFGRPPDRADGTVRNWAEARGIRWSEVPAANSGGALRFELWVDNQHAADTELWIDANGLPLRRVQTVRFPTGTMRVTERYTFR